MEFDGRIPEKVHKEISQKTVRKFRKNSREGTINNSPRKSARGFFENSNEGRIKIRLGHSSSRKKTKKMQLKNESGH